MTLKGFECMLLTHGVNAFDRMHGYTRKDKTPDEPRIAQIEDWLAENDPGCENWIALDDLTLSDDPRCRKIDGKRGIQSSDIQAILNQNENLQANC